jgi:hypothetical protein
VSVDAKLMDAKVQEPTLPGVPAGGKKSVNAVWSYEDLFPAGVQSKRHVAPAFGSKSGD